MFLGFFKQVNPKPAVIICLLSFSLCAEQWQIDTERPDEDVRIFAEKPIGISLNLTEMAKLGLFLKAREGKTEFYHKYQGKTSNLKCTIRESNGALSWNLQYSGAEFISFNMNESESALLHSFLNKSMEHSMGF